MLKELNSRERYSSFILIEDTVQCSGIKLLRSFLLLSKNDVSVNLFLFENSSQRLLNSRDDIPFSWHIHDVHSDPLGWEQKSNSIHLSDDIYDIVEKTNDSCKRKVVVIDSLSSLILNRSVAYTCQVLHRFVLNANEKNGNQVIALCHQDVHDDLILMQIRHLAQTVISLKPPKLGDTGSFCSITHRRRHGKVLCTEEEFTLSASCHLLSAHEVDNTNLLIAKPKEQLDPTQNLSFRLSLTEQEKEARSRVKLPYLFEKERKDILLQQQPGREPEIFYEPDERDDFDPEDPDEDLNI